MAYFGITGSPAGILGETIAAALNVNAMLWRTSPAATELEQVTLRWAAELLGLPTGWFGQITDTASSSTLWALAAAREAAGLDVRTAGWPAAPTCPRCGSTPPRRRTRRSRRPAWCSGSARRGS